MRRRWSAGLVTAGLAGASLLAACIKRPPDAEWTPIPAPAVEAVDAVVFLVGDAGDAVPGRSPLLSRLRDDVARWSDALATDSAVNVIFLGDNIYPGGLRDPDDPSFVRDSLRLHSQVEVLTTPEAARWGTRGFFLAGNHDWGQMPGYDGLIRLQNQEALLRSYEAQGVHVTMVPEAGRPGPRVADAANSVRFVFLDTHWWLQAEEQSTRRDTIFLNADSILRGAGERALLFASHHPFASGGAHGGPVPFWRGLGILWLMRKTGALVQDLNSVKYREFLNGLGALFEEIRTPLIYAGGHDHSLQVIEQFASNAPQWSLVSGSGSKLTDVGPADGMVFGADKPGYMRLFYRKDGAVDLEVVASASDAAQECAPDAPEYGPGAPSAAELAGCMTGNVASYEVVFAAQLRGPRPVVADTAGGSGGR